MSPDTSVMMRLVAFSNPKSRMGLGRLATVLLFIAVLVLALIVSEVLLNQPRASNAPAQKCDPSLVSELKIPDSLCLENLQITIPVTNTSAFIVPVIIVKPGTTTTIEILYQLSSESVQHPGPRLNVTSFEIPTFRLVPSGNVSDLIKCSNGTLVYGSSSLTIFSYNVTTLPGSDGYYAILPLFYFGFYPVLAVGASPGHLNQSVLNTWGYDGPLLTGEFALPSQIVGTGDATLVNATVPMTQICPSVACHVIAHSGS